MMDEKLKTCPFCGSEAVLKSNRYEDSFWVQCSNGKCFVDGTFAESTKEEAIKAWNIRAEQICTNIDKSGYGFHCSACDYQVRYDKYSLYPIEDDELNFCLHCGRRVVE